MSDHLRYLDDSPPPVRTRRHADLWSRARQDYLAGGSAAEVCERHGLSVSTFRWRARNEGWRRADQTESAPDEPFADAYADAYADDGRCDAALWGRDAGAGADHAADLRSDGHDWLTFGDDNQADPAAVAEPPDPPAAASPAELRDRAWANAALAIRRGRMIEARGWTRLHRELDQMVRDEERRARRAADTSETRALAELRSAIADVRAAMPPATMPPAA